MKNTLLILTLIITTITSYSQTIQVDSRVSVFKYDDVEVQDHRNNHKSWEFYMVWVNDEYQYAIDVNSITMTLAEVKKLSELMSQMITHPQLELNVKATNYRLARYDFNPDAIYLYADGGYQKFSKEMITEFAEKVTELR